MKGNKMSEKTFDEMLSELETIVRNLESGRVGLEEALTAYQQGMNLKKACDAKLAAAKEQIDKCQKEIENIKEQILANIENESDFEKKIIEEKNN